jgi:acetyltransferase-like isoleucine patch superfamily enzyme
MINLIYSNVIISEGTIIDPPCIIGKPPRGCADGEKQLIIGKNCHIRPFTTIYAGTVIGDNVHTGQNVSIREDNILGNNVSVGTCTSLEIGNRIGAFSRIHTGCFLELITIGKYVFVGPHVVFTDDPHPMCPRYKECVGGATVEDYVKIGANSTILPGVKIGRHSLIGAGSVIVSDVPEKTVFAGNPAKFIKNIDELKCFMGFFEKPYEWEPYNLDK